MAKKRISLFLFLWMLLAVTASSQSGFYIPKKGTVFFKGDTATVFSDVVNEGKLGIGKTAVVNFRGEKWTNTNEAEIAADTTVNGIEGGWVQFTGAALQQLDAGYNTATKTGAVFQHLRLQNSYGVELINSSAKIGSSLHLNGGLFNVNGQVLTIGHFSPGTIKGYDSSKYIVTANGGLLVREGLTASHDWVVFPIGSKAHNYTPLALRAVNELPDDFYASVFDSVKQGITTGNLLMAQSVGKTWNIGRRLTAGDSEVEIALQHLNSDEGDFFSQNKTKAYVSQFAAGSWDLGFPQTHPAAGYLTSGLPLQNSGVNSRSFFSTVGSSSYFTKFTGEGDTTRTRLWFNAYRLNPNDVKVYWQTQPELNIKYFVVQRRLANEAVFKNTDTVSSNALNGYSRQLLNYSLTDPNGYTGISFYRLLSVQYNNDTAYSQTVAVGNKAGEYHSELWPNPTSGNFYISLNTAQPVKKILIWTVLGQKVWEQETDGQRVVQVNAFKLAAANYYVSLVGMAGNIIETKKLIIMR